MKSKLNTSRLDPVALATNPRATLLSWQRYEHIVYAAMKVHPQTYECSSDTMRPNTIASRLRDAIRGAITFGYPMSCVPSDLLRWYSETTIRHDHEKVYIGPSKKESVPVETTSAEPGALSFTALSVQEFEAFALLLNNGRLQGPILVANPILNQRPLLHLANLEIIHRPDGAVVLL